MFEAPSYMPSGSASERNELVPRPSPPAGDFDFQTILLHPVARAKRRSLISTIVALLLAVAYSCSSCRHKYTATTQILIDPMDFTRVGNRASPASQQSDAAVLTGREPGPSAHLRQRAAPCRHRPKVSTTIRNSSTARCRRNIARSPRSTSSNAIQVNRAERTYVVDVSVTSRTPPRRRASPTPSHKPISPNKPKSVRCRPPDFAIAVRAGSKELQDRVRDSEEKVEAYKASHNIVGANGELVNEQQLTNLNTQLATARARTAEAKSRLDQIESVKQSKTRHRRFSRRGAIADHHQLRTQYAEIMRREAEQKDLARRAPSGGHRNRGASRRGCSI